jgi:predicted PurR-regulated permease PerM
MPEKISQTQWRTFIVLLLGCLAAVFWMIGPYIMALFLGGTLAMVTYPFFRMLRGKNWGPGISALTLTLGMFLLVVVPATGFVILAVQEGMQVFKNLPDLTAFSPQNLTATASRWKFFQPLLGNPVLAGAHLKDALFSAGQYLTSGLLALARGIPSFIFQTILAMVAYFFFLLDGKRLLTWVLDLSALNTAVQEKLVDTFRTTAISTLQASLISFSIQASAVTLGFWLLGVPGAFLAGGATLLLSWLPVVGSAPVWLAGALYAHWHGSPGKMIALLALGAVFSLTDNVVRALVLRGRAAMHPLVGLIAVFGGLQLFGILGVFLGPIMAAMLISLLKLWPELQAQYKSEN